MDREFFERLYRGYAAEHFVSSALAQRGYETFRIPADFGLDLVVTNQFKLSSGDADNAERFPYGIQVKSRWLLQNEMTEGPHGRPELTVTFSLKEPEFNLLIAQQTTGVAFVTFVDAKVFRCIWVDSQNLNLLRQQGFLRQNGGNLLLTVVYRLKPTIGRAEFIQRFTEHFPGALEASAYLDENLPDRFNRNWRAEDYLRFARSGRDGVTEIVYRSVWDVAENFETFPQQNAIAGLD